MYYMVIQNSYDKVQIALIHGTTQISSHSLSKLNASKELITHISALLKSANISLDDLSFIAANCGPGPFTTLRVVITTVNGLSYAKKIPLIGVNALKAAAHEWHDPAYPITAVLFNAFGNDVYALAQRNDQELLYGVYPIEKLLDELKAIPETIRFMGNGTTLHKELILKECAHAYIPEDNPVYCSLSAISSLGREEWELKKTKEYSLEPVYLKQHPAAR